jgi:protein transport protein SEC20
VQEVIIIFPFHSNFYVIIIKPHGHVIIRLKRELQSQALVVHKRLTSKDELLRTRHQAKGSLASQTSKEDPLKSSKKLTQTLQQALEMMDTELSRSIETARTLDTSTKTLGQTVQELGVFGSLLQSASAVMGRLHRKQWIDWALLGLGLLLFLSSVGYIVSRRL